METYRLIPHPETPAKAVTTVSVEVIADPADDILMTFLVTGSADLVVPDWVAAERRDGLWKTTCFELFLKPVDGESYFEFNFSPSTQWAAYRFERYRSGRSALVQPVDPFLTQGEESSDQILEVDLDLSGLPNVPMRISLSAVIEERDGTKSYWALAHPPGKPDFHHPDCFTLELAAAGQV